jgi:hypothetical protein
MTLIAFAENVYVTPGVKPVKVYVTVVPVVAATVCGLATPTVRAGDAVIS